MNAKQRAKLRHEKRHLPEVIAPPATAKTPKEKYDADIRERRERHAYCRQRQGQQDSQVVCDRRNKANRAAFARELRKLQGKE